MTTDATFELAAFADAVTKASRVAPTKGAALDKSAGVVIEVDPDKPAATMRATDLEVSLVQAVTSRSVVGDAASWRVPSKLLDGLMRALTSKSEGDVQIKDTGDGFLYFKCGKTRLKLRLVTGSYPVIPSFDRTGLVTAPDLAARLKQVAWATDKRGSGALAGVHIDGERMIGCDRSSLAVVPCTVPITDPVTAPLTEVASVIRNTSEVWIGATEHRLNIMPDDHTWASTVLIKDAYPDVMGLPFWGKSDRSMTIHPGTLQGLIDRTLVLMKEERLPSAKIEVGDGYLKMTMTTDSGTVIDEMEVKGGHADPLTVSFNPEVLRNALNATSRPEVDIAYGPTNMDPFILTDDTGYTAMMMVMRSV